MNLSKFRRLVVSAHEIPASSYQSIPPKNPQSAGLADHGLASLSGPILALLTSSICFLLAILSHRLIVTPENMAPIWMVNAVVIAMMARVNRFQWCWILMGQALGCFVANRAESIPLASTCYYACGNVLEAFLAATVLTRFGTDPVEFFTLRHFFRLLIAAIPLNVLTAALVAGANFHFTYGPAFISFVESWVSGDCLAILLLVPMLLSIRRPVRGQVPIAFIIEASLFVTAFVLVGFGLFCRQMAVGMVAYHRPLVAMFPFFLFAALRTNVFTISLSAAIFAGFALTGTLAGRGPFVGAEPTMQQTIAILQFSLIARTIGGLVISVVMEENRRALKEVSREHERFRRISESIDEVFWMVEVGVRQTVYISPAYEKVWGRSCESLIANPKSFIDAIHPDDRERVVGHLPIQETGRSFTIEYRVVRPDGSIRWVFDRGFPVTDGRGKVTHYAGVAQDITERKHSEELLQQSHERFRALSAATFEGIVIHEDGRIIDCNEQSARMLGYERDEFIGMPIEPFIPPEDRQRVLANIVAGRDSNIQHGAIRKDGSRITAEARGRHASYEGRQVRVTAIRDITDRIRMEELAIQSEKMLSIGGLAAGLAHEINNPLAIMMQNAEVVLHRIRTDSPANQAAATRAGTTIEAVLAFMQDREILEMLSGIHKSGERAAAIIRNMLAFSRARSSSMSIHRLDELLDQAIRLAHSDFELKKRWELGRIEVLREFDPELGPISCHASEIQQVLFNLLKNAVQAFALDDLAAAPPRIIVRTRREKDHARVDVEDNGPGMPESVRRRVFEPLFTTKGPGEGTGLGLFVSYFIISQHHKGTMSVNATPTGGTRFEITLPVDGD
jgi:PAS domain S-box-containing protein